MRPTRNNYYPFRSTTLNVFESQRKSGIDVLFRVDLRAFLCYTPHEFHVFLRTTGMGQTNWLAETRNLPQRKLMAIPTDKVPEFAEIKPIKDLRKAVAMLAMTDLAGYGPERPVVVSEARLQRDLVYCIPHRYYAAD